MVKKFRKEATLPAVRVTPAQMKYIQSAMIREGESNSLSEFIRKSVISRAQWFHNRAEKTLSRMLDNVNKSNEGGF